MFDIQKLTLGEIDKVESLAGQSVGQLGEDDAPKGKMLAALAFVVKRREETAAGNPPSFTWNEAMDLTMDQANDILGFTESDEEEEEAPAPNREARRAAAKKAPKKVEDPDPTPGE